MKYVREFTCGMTGEKVVICLNEQGVEVAMSHDEFTSEHYCPVNVPSKEELEQEVKDYMAYKSVSRRVALHSLIEMADNSSEMATWYCDDLRATEQYNKSLRLVEMLENEPPVEYPKNTLGNLCPQLAQLCNF